MSIKLGEKNVIKGRMVMEEEMPEKVKTKEGEKSGNGLRGGHTMRQIVNTCAWSQEPGACSWSRSGNRKRSSTQGFALTYGEFVFFLCCVCCVCEYVRACVCVCGCFIYCFFFTN